ncbi:unnamed protein product [[Candida] boidinii]|uniref:Unnamed protein product n=1 Tax=Candida boidinii TaxID=5477 RepID=A0A9W6WD72_CANBO|nr:hypothetical protein BVG19_g5181 [[Candida] boidinii]OWB49842.1 hypothetical protein B5S27_g1386 [[Candida] boidinii]OWB66805.1 hypothetical protein B5S30_g2151 [[Candida] boidinii]GME66750.1 unnamed protein product [[Candida] boidinii]GMF49719.1 unnamed protein product [[Candida] boidinii]
MEFLDSTTINVCFLGAIGCGKSSLTMSITDGLFDEDLDATVEDIYRREIAYEGNNYDVQILDTVECDDYSESRRAQFSRTDIFVLVFSITDKSSFDAAVYMHDRLKNLVGIDSNIPILLIGCKNDLDHERQVSLDNGKSTCAEIGCTEYIECSSKSSYNIDFISQKLCEYGSKSINHKKLNIAQPVSINDKPSTKKSVEQTRDNLNRELLQEHLSAKVSRPSSRKKQVMKSNTREDVVRKTETKTNIPKSSSSCCIVM